MGRPGSRLSEPARAGLDGHGVLKGANYFSFARPECNEGDDAFAQRAVAKATEDREHARVLNARLMSERAATARQKK